MKLFEGDEDFSSLLCYDEAYQKRDDSCFRKVSNKTVSVAESITYLFKIRKQVLNKERVYMQNNRKVGDAQETRAVLELEKLGYKILQKNFRCRIGEIDIIAQHKGYLVFVEVKYRKNARKGFAAEAVTWKKQKIISRVADYYIRTHCSKIPSCRFDVAALDGDEFTIYENAFEYVPKGF